MYAHLSLRAHVVCVVCVVFTDTIAHHGCDGGCQADIPKEEFLDFMKRVRGGGEVSGEEVLKFAKLFKDDFTIMNLSRAQLSSICKFLNLRPYGTDAFMRWQISRRYTRDTRHATRDTQSRVNAQPYMSRSLQGVQAAGGRHHDCAGGRQVAHLRRTPAGLHRPRHARHRPLQGRPQVRAAPLCPALKLFPSRLQLTVMHTHTHTHTKQQGAIGGMAGLFAQ